MVTRRRLWCDVLAGPVGSLVGGGVGDLDWVLVGSRKGRGQIVAATLLLEDWLTIVGARGEEDVVDLLGEIL